MQQFNVSHDIPLDEFIDDHVTAEFKKGIADADTSSMKGKEFTIQYEIGDNKYCLQIVDGSTLEIIKGGVDAPMLRLHMAENDWRDYISGKVDAGLDRFLDPTQLLDPKRYKALIGLKGALSLKLKKDDGDRLLVNVAFNNSDKPAATLKLKLSNWIAMQNGKKSGPMLFMTGKMKAKGDMGLVMKCQSLMG
ncbi:MAG: SCP2 sterol-binding domain-containing protein [Proteobacteria bacterium]|nr:SCP2 sterol-binding domain-containing protein [Pseudomonadota bacterium]